MSGGGKKKGKKHSMELFLQLYPLWLELTYPFKKLGFHVLPMNLLGDISLFNQNKTLNSKGLICYTGRITDRSMAEHYWDVCQEKLLFSFFLEKVIAGDIDVDAIPKFKKHMAPHVSALAKTPEKQSEKRSVEEDDGGEDKNVVAGKHVPKKQRLEEATSETPQPERPNESGMMKAKAAAFVKRCEMMIEDKLGIDEDVIKSFTHAYKRGWIKKITYKKDLVVAYEGKGLKDTGFFELLSTHLQEDATKGEGTGKPQRIAAKKATVSIRQQQQCEEEESDEDDDSRQEEGDLEGTKMKEKRGEEETDESEDTPSKGKGDEEGIDDDEEESDGPVEAIEKGVDHEDEGKGEGFDEKGSDQQGEGQEESENGDDQVLEGSDEESSSS
jgi:hypothetical protein